MLAFGDIGFQLSVLGFLGIAYLEGPIKSWWAYENAGPLSWKDGVVTTIAVLVPMVPLIAQSDGQFPLTAIASNVLIFFATPATVIFGFLLTALGFVAFQVALVVAKLGAVILAYQLAVIKLFSVVIVPLPLPFQYTIVAFLYYALIAIFAFYYYEGE